MKKQAGITHTQAPDMGISKSAMHKSVDVLNIILADEFTLLVQTLNYHWNLVGPEFNDYHKLFDDHYKTIFGYIDDIAERIRSVGGIAIATMTEFLKISRIKEDLGDIPAPKDMVANLLHSHEIVINAIREGVNISAENNNDMGTNNFLADLLEKHEKIAWMLRSLLERR